MNEKIIEHYGIRQQMKYMMSEVYELIEAILEDQIKFHTNLIAEKQHRLHVAEEIADVYVFLDQFCSYYGIKWEEVKMIAERKIDRQTERLEKEKEMK